MSNDSQPQEARQVLVWSTTGFTMMFAVWLMFGVLGIPIREEFGLTDVQLSWITAVAILNGAIWRLPAGIMADRLGGKKVFIFLIIASAIPTYLVSNVHSYEMLLFYAFLIGFAGNSFSVGVAWVSAWFPKDKQGLALGVYGAGNVGASVTKFVGPSLIAIVPAAGFLGGVFPGGWRFIPVLYAAILIALAVLTFLFTPHQDIAPSAQRDFASMLKPLRQIRVWRFSLYYVVVFGAYVALSAWLPKYYVDVYGFNLSSAALTTAIFIFPASLLRPLGGFVSDRIGARKVMYFSFGMTLITAGILMMPYGHIVWERFDGSTSEVMPWRVEALQFTVLVFLMGCAMGIGKAAVFKHIPEYFPHDVGAVGGLVGSLGALGGFFMPPLFAYTAAWSGAPQSTFGVIFLVTLIAALWMHFTIWSVLHRASPELANKFEHENLANQRGNHS